MTMEKEKTRILFVQQEMKSWQSAKMWGYSWHVGLEDGFSANGAEVTTLLSPWFSQAKKLCAGKTFDQVWINDITHMFEPKSMREFRLTEADLEWLAGLAPVRLGFVIESLQYTLKEYTEAPFLQNTFNILKKTIGYLTHVMAADENDFTIIRQLRDIPLSWLMAPIPQCYLANKVPDPTGKKPFFYGTPYGERARWLAMPSLSGLLEYRLSSDNDTDFPKIFDRLHRNLNPLVISNKDSLDDLYGIYLKIVRDIRRRSFEMYLENLGQGCAVVNLPSYGKVHTGRVYEGMAAGRPVITMNIKDSPRMSALFEHEKEILLYSRDEPLMLAEHIQKILDEPEFALKLALNAQDKMLRFHTTEKRIRQILEWIETGREADFSDDSKESTERTENNIECYPNASEMDPTLHLSRFDTKFKKQLSAFGFVKHLLFILKIWLNESFNKLLTIASRIKSFFLR